MPAMRGLSSYGARVSAPPMGAPHATVGGGRVERSCTWTRTILGFADRVGCSDGGWWCLVEEGSGRHHAGWRSPRVKRRWLKEANYWL